MKKPRRKRSLTLERLLPLACLIGGLLLIGSEFLETFRIEGAQEKVFSVTEGGERHSWAMLVLGIAAVISTVLAVSAGSKPAAIAVAVAGLAALLLFLLIDLPDAGKVGNCCEGNPEVGFQVAEARPESGFWVVLMGSLILAVCGAAMATLSRAQLRALKPGAKPETEGSPREKPEKDAGPAPEAAVGAKPKTTTSEKTRTTSREKPEAPWRKRDKKQPKASAKKSAKRRVRSPKA